MKIEVKNERIGVAVSGGVDSMVLLRLFVESGADFCVINVEHGIRGESSARDSEFVAEYCQKNGIECHVEHADVPKYAEERKISLELAARELRYRIFEKYLDGIVDKIALAHHADDNAETVLMRIFRGTGIRGLKGITDRDRYIRPLLGYSREDILRYAEENNVEYVTDESNFDSAYTRNFIRNELLPLIKTRYPSVVDSISRLSKNACEIDDFMTKNEITPEKLPNGYILRGFFEAESAIEKYSLNATMRMLGIVKDVEYVNFGDVLSLGERNNGAAVDLPFGAVAEKRDSDLLVALKRTDIFEERSFSPDTEYTFDGRSYRFFVTKEMRRGLTFDGKKVEGCVVRTRRDGDKFRRVNGKNKLLSDFLNEKKLSKREKDSLLVLARGGTVYVVLGLEVAEEAKIDEGTKTILYTEVKEKAEYDE